MGTEEEEESASEQEEDIVMLDDDDDDKEDDLDDDDEDDDDEDDNLCSMKVKKKRNSKAEASSSSSKKKKSDGRGKKKGKNKTKGKGKNKNDNDNDDTDRYTVGSLLAIDLYGDGNYFEAELKSYIQPGTSKAVTLNSKGAKNNSNCLWAKLHYLHGDQVLTNDLNLLKVVDLSKETVIEKEDNEDEDDDDMKEEEEDTMGFLGRRIVVQWSSGIRYSGVVMKYTQKKTNFIYIKYDDGDSCWYDLDLMKKKESRHEMDDYDEEEEAVEEDVEEGRTKTKKKKKSKDVANTTTTSSKRPSSSSSKKGKETGRGVVKKESSVGTAAQASEGGGGVGTIEQALARMKQKYPIGSPLSVAYHHDEHFYPCIVKKYHTPTKLQVEKGEEWIFAQFAGDKTKQWVDLNCIHYMKILPEETWTLEDDDNEGEGSTKNSGNSSLLGKKIDVVWNDGNEYCGIVTKTMKNNRHFVFLEYSDGDKCWCDLREEYEWSIREEEEKEKDETGGDENASSTSSKNSNKKRKASSTSATTTTTTAAAAAAASTKKKGEKDTKKMKGPGATTADK